jgi:hypothetical protein
MGHISFLAYKRPRKIENHKKSKEGVIMESTFRKLEKNGISLVYADIVRICEKYHISELSIFGSALRDDFRADSDVDFLIVWKNYLKKNGTWDFIYIENDLEKLVGRDVDVVDKECIRNPIRRAEILSTYEVIYATQ